MAKILIADDDVEFVETLRDLLAPDHHVIDLAYEGQEAEAYLLAYDYDLIVLDWDMPKSSGLELCKRFRARGKVAPILMLTGKTATEEKEAGLDAGADDYLTKPFEPRELKARLRALLRRPAHLVSDTLVDGELVLESANRRATKADKEVPLQPLEYSLLEFFMRNPNTVFSPDDLQRKVWDSADAVSTHAIYSAIGRLRAKLNPQNTSQHIVNIHGHGYKFVPQKQK